MTRTERDEPAVDGGPAAGHAGEGSRAAADLIIPVRNERENVDALFDALDGLTDGVIRRVIVADNGSTDGSGEMCRARGAVVVTEPRPGYGRACQAGVRRVREDAASGVVEPPVVAAFVDADLADDPGELPQMVRRIVNDEVDVVIASRCKRAEPGALSPQQRFGNWLATRLIAWATGRGVSDLGPMRAIRWADLERLGMTDQTWGWTVEMNYKAIRAGLRIAEFDAPYRRRHAGKSKIAGSLVGSAKAGRRILEMVAILWWLDRRGRLFGGQDARVPEADSH